MATGRLGTANITTTSNTTVYTVPASTFSVVSINICNRGASSANVRIAIASSGTPAIDEYIEYDSQLQANGILERTGIVMDAGKQVVIQTPTSSPTMSVMVYGIETSTA